MPYSEEHILNDKFQHYSVQIATPDQFIHPEDRIARSDHTWHGAAIMWHESLNSNVVNISNTNDRFTGIKLNFRGESILAISAYLPTSGKDDDFLCCMDELSNFLLENCADTDTILIGTDSNCSARATPRRLLGFQHFCEDHNLLKICSSEPTFHHSNGTSSSNIDMFLISRNRKSKLSNISLQCNQEHPENFSSHDPVMATLSVPSHEITVRKEKYSHTYSEFTKSRVIWNENNLDTYQRTAGQILSEYEQLFREPDFIPLKCQLYSELLVKAGEICLETKSPRIDKKVQHCPQVHHAWKHLQKYFKIWKKEGKPRAASNPSYMQYRQSRANFQQIRRYQFNLKSIKNNNYLMTTNASDRNKYFQLVKRLRGVSKKQKLSELQTAAGTYYGSDTLEGFAKDAELLGEYVGESSDYDNEFYRLCIQDNQIIFEMKDEYSQKIPKMIWRIFSTRS